MWEREVKMKEIIGCEGDAKMREKLGCEGDAKMRDVKEKER